MHHQKPINSTDIQTHLARYLSRHDLLQCACVCKSWNETFLLYIWRYQHISWRRLRPSIERLKTRRHLVHTLEIEPRFMDEYVLNYPRLHSLIIKSGGTTEKWVLDLIK